MVTIKPNKQRKAVIKAPLHIKGEKIVSTLSKDLRKQYKKRAVALRKGDVVEIMRGSQKGKKGKVIEVNHNRMIVNVEGITLKKKDGKEVAINFDASNLRIVEVYKDDERRFKHVKEA